VVRPAVDLDDDSGLLEDHIAAAIQEVRPSSPPG